MALFKATQVVNKQIVPSANGASMSIVIVGDFTIPAAFAAADVVEMVPLPAGYVPVGLTVDNDINGAVLTAGVGLLTGAFDAVGARTCGSEALAAAAFGTAGLKYAAVAGFTRLLPTAGDRGIGFVASAVTTPTVGSKIRFTLRARPMLEGV